MATSVHPGAAAPEPSGRPRPQASAAGGPGDGEDGQDHDSGGEATAGEEEEVGDVKGRWEDVVGTENWGIKGE